MNGEMNSTALSSGVTAPQVEEAFPEIEAAVRFREGALLLERGMQRFVETDLYYADPSVFDVFSLDLLRGDAETALDAPYTMIVTPELARKYFGDEDPLGETLEADGQSYTITGLFEKEPKNAHLRYDALVSMSTIEDPESILFTEWPALSMYTYVLLQEGASVEALTAKFPPFLAEHAGSTLREMGAEMDLVMEPITDIYLHSERLYSPGGSANLGTIYVFAFIAFFILLIACVNFMNLATARSAERAREVGVRKVVGAQRGGLVAQFLIESVVLTVLATAVALVLAELAFPLFESLAGKTLSRAMLTEPTFLLALLGVAVLVGLLAGSYPAFALSSFKPITVLKGTFQTSRQGALLRKGLVVFQFGISVALIAGTAVVSSQLSYLQRQDLGFDGAQTLTIDFMRDAQVQRQLETVKARFEQHPDVVSATASLNIPGKHGGVRVTSTDIDLGNGETRQAAITVHPVDFDFLSQFGIEVVAGRVFDRDRASDSTSAMILNEAAISHLGFASPEAALGKPFEQGDRTGEIIGVVRDYHFRSLRQEVDPVSLVIDPDEMRHLSLRLQSADMMQTVDEIEGIWREMVPHRPFEYAFVSDIFDAQYEAERRFGQLFGVFAGLAILIACLGLFGLASFTIQQRTKEIGVRKVMGASVPEIVALLSKDFAKLVAVAFVAASPLIYVVMNRWLMGFAYRTSIGADVFLFAGAVALVIALVTVSYQSIRAASANPIEALRYE